MKSIDTYSLSRRVALYDKDMDIMHPNRPKMVNVGFEFLQFLQDQNLNVLDLGVGTGFFTIKLLENFPNAKVVALDGAEPMIDLAKTRCSDFKDKIDYKVGDFRQLLGFFDNKKNIFDIVVTSFALHHLTFDEKLKTMKDVFSLLKPGGWFINADNIIAEADLVEKKFQELRINGIVERGKGIDKYKDFKTARACIDKLQQEDDDKPLKLSQELEIIKKCDFVNVDILWKEYREVVICAQKPVG